MDSQMANEINAENVHKRLMGWLCVVLLGSSLITSCSSAGNNDCKILSEAKKELVPSQVLGENYNGISIVSYYSKIDESQLLFKEPKVLEEISKYKEDFLNAGSARDTQAYLDAITHQFVKKKDNYCNSL